MKWGEFKRVYKTEKTNAKVTSNSFWSKDRLFYTIAKYLYILSDFRYTICSIFFCLLKLFYFFFFYCNFWNDIIPFQFFDSPVNFFFFFSNSTKLHMAIDEAATATTAPNKRSCFFFQLFFQFIKWIYAI